MSKLFKLLCVLLVLAGFAEGQSLTTVTGTIHDPSGQAFIFGTVKADYQRPSQSAGIIPLSNGLPIVEHGPPNNVGMNGSGFFTVHLADLSTVVPVGGTWRFTFCPNATTPCAIADSQLVTGASVDLSAMLNAQIPNIVVTTQPTLSRSYIDAEVILAPGIVWLDVLINNLKYVDALGVIHIIGNGNVFGTGTPGVIPVWLTTTSLGDSTFTNIVNEFSGCSGTLYLGADGHCHGISGLAAPGSDKQLIFNDAGILNGVNPSSWDKTNLRFSVGPVGSISSDFNLPWPNTFVALNHPDSSVGIFAGGQDDNGNGSNGIIARAIGGGTGGQVAGGQFYAESEATATGIDLQGIHVNLILNETSSSGVPTATGINIGIPTLGAGAAAPFNLHGIEIQNFGGKADPSSDAAALYIFDQGTGATDSAIRVIGGKNDLGPQNTTVGNLTDSALTSGNCVQAGTAGILTTIMFPCNTFSSTSFPAGTNSPQRITLGAPVSLSTDVQTIILTESVTFPSITGTYRADARYGMWVTVGPNLCVAAVIDTTNSHTFASSGQNTNGSGFIGMAGSEISSNTYAASAVVTFTLQIKCNTTATVTINSGAYPSFTPAESTYLAVTPILSN